MRHESITTMTQPQGDGADRPYANGVDGPQLPEINRDGWIAQVNRELNKQTFTTVGDLLRAIDREVLRDVLPAYARVTALAGERVIAEDWTVGRVRFTTPEERTKAFKRLGGLVALALAHAESPDGWQHWRLCSSFIRQLALLEYQNAVTALKHQREMELTVEQVTVHTSDVALFGTYAGVLS